MKKYTLLVLLLITLFSCKDDYVDGNSYLPNKTVNFTVNLLLSEGNALQTSGYATFEGEGIEGVIIFNNGLDNFTAFDLACPHVPIQGCSKMTFEQTDLYLVCPCDGEKFSKLDGSALNPSILQSARVYQVTKNGNILYIRN